jgi:hypothetical protein
VQQGCGELVKVIPFTIGRELIEEIELAGDGFVYLVN